jgi:hypothetical protein
VTLTGWPIIDTVPIAAGALEITGCQAPGAGSANAGAAHANDAPITAISQLVFISTSAGRPGPV